VAAVDPDFGGVRERIAELECMEERGKLDEPLAEQQEETFEAFDDLVKGVEPQPENEGYECFEDLLSEDGDDGDEAFDDYQAPIAEEEPVAEELDAEPAPELEPAPEPSAPKKPARRKKISFV
jgi:hypothetical protein